MTPNLSRLFAETKNDTLEGERAYDKLGDLFDCHGEALITALWKLANEASGFNSIVGPDVVGHTNKRVLRERIDIARQLLAQLEAEAQP